MDADEIDVDPCRISVFIDPLDGTKAYAGGDYGPVSILIAIIVDEKPCFGVICKPFGYKGQTEVLDTGCVAIYGGTLLGGAFTAGGTNAILPTRHEQHQHQDQPFPPALLKTENDTAATTPCSSDGYSSDTLSTHDRDHSDALSSRRLDNLPRAVISSSKSKGVVEEFVAHLGERGMIHPTPLLITGAGEKSLRIVLRSENEGLWFYPKAGTSLWDVAASDALLRATGGRLTDKNGNDLDYSKSRTEAENENGVVACYDYCLHAECIKLFLEGPWNEPQHDDAL
jgi:3'-phosphoadenosine 5'-phosphosulfate (PAPS) 3'-phosphatase